VTLILSVVLLPCCSDGKIVVALLLR